MVLSCFIASTPGAGIRPLAEALGATGALKTPKDYFNPLKVPARSRAWGILGSENQFAARYLALARSKATDEHGTCSVTLLWPHLRWLARVARYASSSKRDGGHSTDAEEVEACFPNPHYVHLSCEDTARQALRWYAALHPEICGRGDRRRIEGRSTPDFHEVGWLETLILRHERSWQGYFQLHAIVAENVLCERFRAHPDDTVRSILKSLELSDEFSYTISRRPDPTDSEPGPYDSTPDAWLEPYLAVRPKLRNSLGIQASHG